MNQKTRRDELGQNLIIFAVVIVVLVALAGLVIDGGFAYAKRREAQNAADAGALAGVEALCAGEPATTVQAQALDYAITRNGADSATVDIGTKSITVTATIPHETFFARIFGANLISPSATASAGCYSPCVGTGVLPVAWACHPPIEGLTEPGCEILYGNPGPTYVIMDSNKAIEDYYCQSEGGTLDCDIDNDNVDDYMIGGGRSWLDLDGDAGGHTIKKDWITDGFDGDIFKHLWLPASDGTATDIYKAAQERMITNPYVVLPVFDEYTVRARPDDPNGGYYSLWHAGLDQIRPYNNDSSADYYHIISFSVLKITCVSKNSGQYCDGKHFLMESTGLAANTKTIEGYFVEEYIPGLSGKCDYDAGAYTIYLNH
jgi:hypothetical protein